jgi:hypothetical protein
MSGPGLDYLEYRLQELAEMISRKGTRPEHRAFAKHLLGCAKAAILLGMVFEGDCSSGDEIPLIRDVLAPQDTLNQAIDEAQSAAANLRQELECACGRHRTPPMSLIGSSD